jgi:hypothetical protein
MTLGNAAKAELRLIVWCRSCGHRDEPNPAELAQRYVADTPVSEWRERLVCSRCDGWECRARGERDQEPMSVTAGAMLH